MKNPKKVLFLVGSTYQLFNAIVLRMTVCRDADCDLLLRSGFHWQEDALDRLREEKVFGRIHRPHFTKIEKKFWELSTEEKTRIMDDPLLFFGKPPVKPVYDELFAGPDHIAWKLIYRYHRLNGVDPVLYCFDEGSRSYMLDYPSSDDKPWFMGEYANTSYAKAIRGIYLYQPDLYAVPEYSYELRQLPNPANDPEVKQTLLKVFGVEPLPKEPFLYFEDFLFADRHASNDMELFRRVAALVGEGNLIAKTHPRADKNRFEKEGYPYIGESRVPWEVQLLAEGIGNRTLVSVFSTAMYTPFIIFDKPVHVVSLMKLYRGQNPLQTDVGYQRFFAKLAEKMNREKVYLHMPETLGELEEALRFAALENRLAEQNNA